MAAILENLLPQDSSQRNKIQAKERIMSAIKSLKNNQKLLIMSSLVLVISFIAYYATNSSSDRAPTIQNKHHSTILRELNDIHDQLNILSKHSIHGNGQEAAINSIARDVIKIQNSFSELARSTDISKVSQQIASMQEDVDSKMGDIRKTVVETMGNKNYLDASALPFQVISVDVIGGQPYVSVDYGHHVSPLGLSDVLAGWRLLAADFDSGVAEFSNNKNQYVKISLQNPVSEGESA